MYQINLTNTGQNKQAASLAPGGSPVVITHVAVGDAGGTPYEPTGSETTLVNERWRGALAQGQAVTEAPGLIRLETYMPASVGGYTIREVGLFDADGDMIAIGALSWPKAALTDGSAEDLRVVINLRVSSPESFTLQVDPTVAPVSLAQMQEAAETAKSEAIQAAADEAGQALSDALQTVAQDIATAKGEAIQESGQAAALQVSALADQIAKVRAKAAAAAASIWSDVPVSFGSGRIRAVCGGKLTTTIGSTFVVAGDGGKIMMNTYLNLSAVPDSTFGGSNINSLAMGDDVVVAVGEGGKIATSPTGWAWTARTSGTTTELVEVIHTPDGFFAQGGNNLLHSPDGIAWADINPFGDYIRGIAYGDGELVVCASDSMYYSLDAGSSWESVSNFPDYGLLSIAVGHGLIVGVDMYGYVWVTPDHGATWHSPPVETMDATTLYTVRFDGQVFVAASDDGKVLVSPDGFEWASAPIVGSVMGASLSSLAPTPAGWLLGGQSGKLQRTMRIF